MTTPTSPPVVTVLAVPGSAQGLQIGPVQGATSVIRYGGEVLPFSLETRPTTFAVVSEPGGFDGAELGQNPGVTPGTSDIGGGAVGGGGSAEGATGTPVEHVIPIVWSTPVPGYDPDAFPSGDRIYPIRRA